jgi:DNA polymerase-3 subunit beta
MKFSCDRDDLFAAVTASAQGLPARPQHPVYAGILVSARGEVVQLTASDGFTVCNCITDAETEEDGRLLFPRVFTEIVKELPKGKVEIQTPGGTGVVTGGKSRFTVPLLPGGDFPLPSLELPLLGEVDGPEFRMTLRKVLSAVNRNSATPALTAILMQAEPGMIKMVATDHYRLAVADCDIDLADCDYEGRTFLLPGTVAEKAARMEGVSMALAQDGNMIQVRSGGFTITCPQVSGKFPKWDIILSMGEQWTKLPEGLGDAVRRAALTLGEKEAVMLDFDQIALTVKTDGSKGGFMEAFAWDYEGGPVNVRVGHSLLKDALAWCDEISAEKGRPLLFRGRNCRYMTQVRRGDD